MKGYLARQEKQIPFWNLNVQIAKGKQEFVLISDMEINFRL